MASSLRTSTGNQNTLPSRSLASSTADQALVQTPRSDEKLLVESQQWVRAEPVLRKLDRHLLTKFLLLTILCYLDRYSCISCCSLVCWGLPERTHSDIEWACRTNLAFAALTLNSDLKLTSSEYGIGSGIFFMGYTIFQVGTK